SPPSTTRGSPASRLRTRAGAASAPRSAFPAPSIWPGTRAPSSSTYCTSVNPSALKSSSPMYTGARQIDDSRTSLIRVVSGGASAHAWDDRTIRRPVVAPTLSPCRNCRRLTRCCVIASSLQFFLQLIHEAPVGALDDDLLRA